MKRYCFDLDGTVYRGKTGIPTAVAFIKQLQQAGNEPFYITNNSSKTREQLQEALRQIGIEAPLSHIYSSALSTASYVAQHFKKVRVIGSEGIWTALASQGVEVCEDQDVDALVMGIDRMITYEKLAEASLVVQRGAQLIGTNQDIRFPTETGFVPGNGSFVNLIANVAGVEPIYIGKPSPVMLEMIANEHGLHREELVMVGDNYDTDIMCGLRYGCTTVHVDTGVTPTAAVLTKEQKPDYIIADLSQLNINE